MDTVISSPRLIEEGAHSYTLPPRFIYNTPSGGIHNMSGKVVPCSLNKMYT